MSDNKQNKNLVFWDPSGYKFNSATDWNQWRYVSDGLGGEVGIRFGVPAGFGTWKWDSRRGKAPVGSIGDKIATTSFGKNEQEGMATNSVNAVRMQTNRAFNDALNSYTIELDFSRYKGSKAGGKDGVAGANTFIGVSDIYAGLIRYRTVVTITGTLADGTAASPAGWTLLNGGAVPPSAGGNSPSAQLSLTDGVLQGTDQPAPGGQANSIDTVMGLVRLDAAGYKTLHLRYDMSPVGRNRRPRTDNSGLYVASVLPSEQDEPDEPDETTKPDSKPCTCAEESTTYTFEVLNPDGSVFGQGCFTYAGDESPIDIAHIIGGAGTGTELTSFWYHDPLVGTMDMSQLLSMNFVHGVDGKPSRFTLNAANVPEDTHALVGGVATPDQVGSVSAHRNGNENHSCAGRKITFPKPCRQVVGEPETEAEIPAVDLVVVIDSSVSMRPDAISLSNEINAAIESAKSKCPSDLKVTYLGIEGRFSNSLFDTTIRQHLTELGVAEADMRGRERGSVKDGGAQEDGGRAIEDVSTHHNWRNDTKRTIFFLGDEGIEGGDTVNADDIEAASRAIDVANNAGVRVHTYLADSSAKEDIRKVNEAEYERVASSTGGQFFTSKDTLTGFQAMLEKVICASKTSAGTSETVPCPCSKESVERPVNTDDCTNV